MSRRPLRGAVCAAVAAGLMLPATMLHARKPRPYSLSYEAVYGREPSRATYLEDLRRALGAWVAATGPLGAPTERGEADLHLRLTFHRIVVQRHYPDTSGEVNILFDDPAGRPSQKFSTLFEVNLAVVDPHNDDRIVVEKDLSVFNEQGYTKFIHDPRQRSWDVNVDFFLDRLAAFLGKKRRKITAYLEKQESRD